MTTHASRPRLLAAALTSLTLLGSAGALADTYQLNYKIPGLVKKAPEADTDFTSHTFTTCRQSGRLGPSQAQCATAYSGLAVLEPDYHFTVSNGIQEWTVPADGAYRITALGAQGGDHGNGRAGGRGARMSGDFELAKGQTLKILVGQRGGERNGSSNNNGTGGGGGGSFIALADNTPLLVAGGGGAAGVDSTGNADALSSTRGAAGTSGSVGQGGVNGGGGGAASGGAGGDRTHAGGVGSSCSWGSGGGGFYTRGGYNCGGNAPKIAGESFVNGGFGGAADTSRDGVEGGFGGGGGVGHRAPGGGGYSGGWRR